MKASLPPILIVDDEKNMRASLATLLEDEDYPVQTVDSAEAALDWLAGHPCSLVITDARLGGMSGYELLREIRARHPGLATLMITAYATPKLAVEAIQAGAVDYLPKPFAPEELLHAVARCLEHFALLRENESLRARASAAARVEDIIGDCPAIRAVRNLITTVAPTDARVLILGESGTGKELVAGALHTGSRRADRPYVRLNCAAIPETLLESELFGHERGAFTGALKQKAGRVEEADGGTLFLDEIADMSRPLQAKLLRFLEDGSFTRVGGTQELRVNVRLVAATNRDIIQAIQKGDFREDLFHRLNVVQFRLPPLRERGDDVLLLAEHFRRQFSATMGRVTRGFTAAARDKLRAHTWPGNVRELRNAVERALILETGPEVQAVSLPDFQLELRLQRGDAPRPVAGSLDELLAAYERDVITRTLEQHQHNISRAAEQLQLSRHALRYRMQRLNLSPAEGDPAADPARP
ncbi:MAG: sigma-54-dependent transcriptional regulator [Limisphaerales bacterium]